ncbi:MAG: tol-pal system protein YbgF [Mariprofundaceae bacterium]|nr:tol-pal system protein YbgF [Mariprofundaceae bacterium]
MIWRPSVFAVAAFSLCLLLVGCASGKKQSNDAWTADRLLVLQSVDDLQQRQEASETSLKARQQQLAKLSAELKTTRQQNQAALAAQQEEIGKMKQQIRRLQLAISRLKTTTKRLKKTRQISKEKLDKKIEKIALAIKPVESMDQAVSSEKEKDHYTAAYLALKSGRYNEAIEKFRALLKAYPKGQYSDQTYYWLGESYLVMNNTGRAIGNFEWLIKHHPESGKHAVAMLKLGLAYQSQKRMAESKAIWQKLIQTHADSPAAERARKLLQAIQKQ